MSSLLVAERGVAGAIFSSVLEGVVSTGAIYQLSDAVGVEVNFSGAFGFGFTTVSVISRAYRGSLGMNMFF